MPRYREWDLKCKVYVGNLQKNATKHEIESAFQKYGSLRNVWVARNPPGFAFVEFEDNRDAEDAVRALDGTRVCGSRIRVEMSSGRTRREPNRRGGRDDRGGGGSRSGRHRSRSRSRSHSHCRRDDSRSVSRDREKRDRKRRSSSTRSKDDDKRRSSSNSTANKSRSRSSSKSSSHDEN